LEDLTKRPAIAGIIKLGPMGEMANGVSEGMEDENVWSTRAISGEAKGAGLEGGFRRSLGNRSATTRVEKVLKRARHPLSRTPENWRF